MIDAKIPISTNTLNAGDKVFCAYCGKEIESDVEIDHGERTEYYHCDCPDALNEISLWRERKGFYEKYLELSRKITKLRETAKFKAVAKTSIERVQ